MVRSRLKLRPGAMMRVIVVLLSLSVCCSTVTSLASKDKLWSSTSRAGRTQSVSISPRNRARYTRTADLDRLCPSVTPRFLPLPQPHPQPGGGQLLFKPKHSFRFGDWEESEPGSTSPIIPFLQWDDSTLPSKIKLASLRITDVVAPKRGQSVQRQQLSGMLQLIIVDGQKDSSLPYLANEEPSFKMERGLSVLTIQLEGVYQQSENEDVVCFLGCTYLPSPDGGVHFPNIQNSEGTKNLEKNCDIMVLLNYPLTFNLTSQVVRGGIQSLLRPADKYHFFPIVFSAQFRAHPYESADLDLVDGACSSGANSGLENPNAANSELENSDAPPGYLKPSLDEFCMISGNYFQNSLLEIEPNWNCNHTTTRNCEAIGPFSNYGARSSLAEDYNNGRAQILVESFISTPCFGQGPSTEEIPFSFVLRLVPAGEAEYIARERSGLDGHTLVAEGHWTNGTSQEVLCMVACRVDNGADCNAKITLHIPVAFSIRHRSVLKGSIVSLHPPDDPNSFPPLGFRAKLDPRSGSVPPQLSWALWYNYSRLDEAQEVVAVHEPISVKRLKTPWTKYPSLIGEEEGHYRSVAADLEFYKDVKTGGDQSSPKWVFLSFGLVAIDRYLPFLRSDFVEIGVDTPILEKLSPVASSLDDNIATQTDPKLTHRRQEERKYLNCSGTLEFRTDFVLNVEPERLTIFTEGFYSPLDGKMYMVGCRSVKGSYEQIWSNSFTLVEGMDCDIEVVLEYPTTLSTWLLNPGVKVNVHSHRPVTDLFHFEDISVETYPVLYKGQREKIISRKNVEEALSILSLSLTVICIIRQFLFMRRHPQSAPYVSLFMLGTQAVRFATPLITGAESLLARKSSEFALRMTGGGIDQTILYMDKILTLAALVLLLRLFEKVWRERSLLSELEGESAVNIPKERTVLMICCLIHAFGFVSVMAAFLSGDSAMVAESGSTSANGTSRWWVPIAADGLPRGPLRTVGEEYLGFIEDMFLLPQVVGMGLWNVAGQPLRFSFFMGLTLLQVVLPHVYDYLRSAGHFDLYAPFSDYANPNLDLYTKWDDFLIPALAFILAVLVFCQQRWKRFLRVERSWFLYQPLKMSKTGETELMPTNGRGSHLPPIPEDEDS